MNNSAKLSKIVSSWQFCKFLCLIRNLYKTCFADRISILNQWSKHSFTFRVRHVLFNTGIQRVIQKVFWLLLMNIIKKFRYLAICRPLSPWSRSSIKKAKRTVGLIWLFSFLTAFPWSFFTRYHQHPPQPASLVQLIIYGQNINNTGSATIILLTMEKKIII